MGVSPLFYVKTKLYKLTFMFYFSKKGQGLPTQRRQRKAAPPKGGQEKSTPTPRRRRKAAPFKRRGELLPLPPLFGRWCLPPLPLGGAAFHCLLLVARPFSPSTSPYDGGSLLSLPPPRSSLRPPPSVVGRLRRPPSVVVCSHAPLAAVHTPPPPVGRSPLPPLWQGEFATSSLPRRELTPLFPSVVVRLPILWRSFRAAFYRDEHRHDDHFVKLRNDVKRDRVLDEPSGATCHG